MQQTIRTIHDITLTGIAGRKIMFANFPADGHFNPLTSLAITLKELGADVRWYTSKTYAEKLERMDIPHYGLVRAKDISEIEANFPERNAIKGMVAKLTFDIIHAFVLRGPEYFADLEEIHKEFPFDLLIADCAFTGIPFVIDKMQIPVVSIGVFPLTEQSKDLAPAGLAMTPSKTFLGKLKQRLLHVIADRILFAKANKVMRDTLSAHGVDHMDTNVFNLLVKKSTLLLQSGTPGFEYKRSDLGRNVRFIGALLPYQSKKQLSTWTDPRISSYDKIAVVTQGTVEKDIEKLLVPALEAFKDSEVLLIVTTGGSGTEELRKRYPQKNLIIEDFIPFADIMPLADVYITNGGYGGVMLGIENELPLIVAGVHEGKNEINARVGYFKLGINLRTERPAPAQLRKALDEILTNNEYKNNVRQLAKEFRQYDPQNLVVKYVNELLAPEKKTGAQKVNMVRKANA